MSLRVDLSKLFLCPKPVPPATAAGPTVEARAAAAVLLVLALFLPAALPVDARADVGGTFLTTHHDARGLAMGGACVSLARGDAAVRWNPARLSYGGLRSVTVAHGDVIEDFSSGLTTISVAIPWGGTPTDEYGLGQSARWAIAGFLSHLGLDDVGGSASWSETALSGTASRTLWGFAAVGVSVRYLNVGSDIEGASAGGFAADLAFSLDTTDETRAALVVRNAAGTLGWEGGRDETLPASVDLAFSYTHCSRGAAEMAFNVGGDGVATASIGAEVSVAGGGLMLWGGFKLINDDSPRNVPSFGVGVPLSGVLVGYGASFDSDDTFGTTQRFSVSAGF